MNIKIGRCGGICNTLFGWAGVYEVARINNADVVTDLPEMEHITLPRTTFQTNFDNYINFNSNDPNVVRNNFKLNPNFNYNATCLWGYNRRLSWCNPEEDCLFPIQKLKLKDDILDTKIKDVCQNLVGVHIRRFDYQQTNGRFIPSSGYAIPDKWYISIMEQIVERFPNIEFYLSSNGTQQELQIYYDNFKIINNKNINFNNDKPSNPYDPKTLTDFIDLFALSKCKLIIGSVSTWSMISFILNNTPVIYPETSDQNLTSLRQYKFTPREKLVNINNIL